MKYELIWTPDAIDTAGITEESIKDRWGAKIVSQYLSRLEGVLDHLEINPFIYPTVNDMAAMRRAVVSAQTSIYYFIHGKHVVLLLFWDNRMNPETLLEFLMKLK